MEPEATEKQAAITPDGDKGANDDTSDRADGIVNPVEAEIDVEVGGGMEVICLNEYPLGKVTLEHIISLIGSYENEEAISSRRTRVQEGKDAVRAFAYETIQRIMIDTARTRNMQINGQLVRTFKDCLSSWAQDGTTDQQRCIYEMTYGYFDRNPKWDLELEKEFMQDRNLHYCDSSIHDEAASNKEENANKRGIKGCIARLLGSVKIDLVKRIRRKGERTHGVCINISRDNSEIDDSNRYRKRRKGTEFRVVMKQKVWSISLIQFSNKLLLLKITASLLIYRNHVLIIKMVMMKEKQKAPMARRTMLAMIMKKRSRFQQLGSPSAILPK